MVKARTQKEVIADLPRRQGYVISIANSKGGVGKTTISNLVAYNLARLGIKTLVVDADKQGNATKTMLLTKRNVEGSDELKVIDKSLMQGLIDNNLEDAIVPIMPNLDLIPSGKDTKDFSRHLYLNISNDIDRDYFVHDSIRKVQFNYDIVIIDSPPNNEEVVRNISLASDYILVALQPSESSLTGAEDFYRDIAALKANELYNVKLDILGVLPSLVKRGSRIDNYILNFINHESEEFSEKDVFNNQLYFMERVKQFDVNGITDNDSWDEYVHDKYLDLTIEVLERLLMKEEEKGGIILG